MKHSLILSGYDRFYYINFQGNKINLNLHYVSSAVNSKKYSVGDENEEEKTLAEKLSIVTVYSVLGGVALKLHLIFFFVCLFQVKIILF